MKNMAKIMIVSLIMSILAVGTATAAESGYSDLTGGTLTETVQELDELGIIKGYPDGTFKPDRPVTRAEMATLVIRALNMVMEAEQIQARFSDTNSHWAEKEIALANREGIVIGRSDFIFDPEGVVTVAEAATMLLRAVGYADEELNGSWPENYLDKAELLGLLEGIDIADDAEADRGNIAVMLSNAIDLPIDSDASDTMRLRLNPSPNVTYKSAYYGTYIGSGYMDFGGEKLIISDDVEIISEDGEDIENSIFKGEFSVNPEGEVVLITIDTLDSASGDRYVYMVINEYALIYNDDFNSEIIAYIDGVERIMLSNDIDDYSGQMDTHLFEFRKDYANAGEIYDMWDIMDAQDNGESDEYYDLIVSTYAHGAINGRTIDETAVVYILDEGEYEPGTLEDIDNYDFGYFFDQDEKNDDENDYDIVILMDN